MGMSSDLQAWNYGTVVQYSKVTYTTLEYTLEAAERRRHVVVLQIDTFDILYLKPTANNVRNTRETRCPQCTQKRARCEGMDVVRILDLLMSTKR
jgi:hypothetical protein